MIPENLKHLITRKRKWARPLNAEDAQSGFKGWYASRHLPHRDAPGTRQFMTYRLADAMPAARRSEWQALLHLEDDLEKQRQIEVYLDKGYGSCHLRDSRIAEMVQMNFWHHDGVKYRLLAWVVMPNHVHVLVEIRNVPLGEVVRSWKSYTAKEAIKILRSGDGPSPPRTFWEEDYFDRYLRDDEQYRRVVHYIESNPAKAGLVRNPADWPWSSARFRGEPGPIVPVLTHPTAARALQRE